MLLVGLTGGIGSGKSTFASLLLERGAQVIDADELGRQALEPGCPAWHSVVATFGDEMLAPGSMTIDRQRLADAVFSDRQKLAALNAIVHPIIVKGVADALDVLRGADEVAVLDAALLVEVGLHRSVDVLIVITASEDARHRRLVEGRGMSEKDVTARIASQRSEQELLALADIVVRNDGSVDDLATDADRVWAELVERLKT